MDLLSYLLGKKAGGGGGEAVLINKSISANGTYNASSDSADGYKKVEVAVPNTYGASDEGKVVSNGTLVSQGSDIVTDNDTYDTTLISEMVVNVANSYSAADEGKVVSNGALVSQGSDTVTSNGTVDTTLISSLEVDVPGAGIYLQQLSTTPVVNFVDDQLTTLRQSAFTNCKSTTINLMNVTSIPQDAFSSATCTTIVLPKATSLGYRWCGYCNSLTTYDGIKLESFVGTANVNKLILRKDTIVSMNGTWLNDTKFKNGGAGGDIYIPKSLYDHLGDGTANDYKAATNWSTYDGYGTITWHAIEGSIYETQYADGTPIS